MERSKKKHGRRKLYAPPLIGCSTAELLTELHRRHVAMLFIGLRSTENNTLTHEFVAKGDEVTLYVIDNHLRQKIAAHLVRERRNPSHGIGGAEQIGEVTSS